MLPPPPDFDKAFDLTGRLAVVTGAASGIGREAAIIFARAGARLVAADLDVERLAPTVAAIEAEGSSAIAIAANVADRDAVYALADQAAAIAPIDIWANVAGTSAFCPVVDTEKPLYDRVLGINLEGSYWGCAAAGKHMIPQGRGSIINISSNAADQPMAGLSLYAMTKAALNMLTRTLATELGPHGIRVNGVAPGFTVTAMTAPDAITGKAREELIARNAARSPMGTVGDPIDIALAMLYLASDASRFMTGQTLRVNGGITMP